MKKWIITILAAFATLTMAITVHWWVPWLLSFATKNKEDIEHLNTLAELVSKLVTWPATAILFIIGLWQRKKANDEKQQLDVNIQTGGINAKGNVSQTGNVVTGNKSVSIQGDAVSGDKKTVHDGDLVEGDKYVITKPQPVLPSPHQLPPPPADFTGRTAELHELRAAIAEGRVHIWGLYGQGGVGKTALALKLAEELSPNYPDAQIYLDFKGVSEKPLTAAEGMSHVLRTFHPEAKFPEKEEDLRAQYLSVLHNKRALLLMDNAQNADQVMALIPPSGCTMLVTSRNHFYLPGLRPKILDTLSASEAQAFLLRIAPRIKNEAEGIARLCGYLPQALRLAATALAERIDLSPTGYRVRLSDEKHRLALLGGTEEGIEAYFNVRYNLLDGRTQELWRTLGAFPDTFDAAAVAEIWELEADPAQNSLGYLLKISMLEWNAATGRYRLHDLMRDFARQKLRDSERQTAALRHASHYYNVLGNAHVRYLRGGEDTARGLALFDLEWGNIQAALAWAAERAENNPRAMELCSGYVDLGSYILQLRQPPRERIHWLYLALAAARRLKDRQAEGHHLSGLGLAYDSIGEHRQAIEYHEQSTAVAREIGDRRGEGYGLANLGSQYNALGEFQRALEYIEKAVLVDRESGNRPGEGYALGGLGNAYKNLGDFQAAIECYQQWLTVSREVGDRGGEGGALSGLGNVYNRMGESDRAIEHYQLRLSIAREIGDRRGEGEGLWNMSVVLRKLGNLQEAIKHAEASLKIYEQIEDPNAATVRKQLGIWKNG